MQPSSDPTTEMDRRSDDEARNKVMDLIKKARIAMFGTYDENGTCHSRPMAAADHEGNDELWFFARAESRKLDEIKADPRVTLDYSNESSNDWVSAVGRAEVIHDPAKARELWMEPMRTWFPEGKDDPAIRLIRVELDAAEYWDTPASTVVYAFGYLKALATGETPSPGEVAHVKM